VADAHFLADCEMSGVVSEQGVVKNEAISVLRAFDFWVNGFHGQAI